MIVVTGGAGFIGSVIVGKLNQLGREDIVIVDDLGESDKWKNLVNLRFEDIIEIEALPMELDMSLGEEVSAIIHMGACSATTEKDGDFLLENNFGYTKQLAEWALETETRFIYASSAATYGDGRMGYSDNNEATRKLKPLNMYGYSKHLFDLWAIRKGMLHKFAGLKFFNVFGANEYHKEDMASVIYKAYNQINRSGSLKLFKSDRPDMADGEQKRDFVYVKDCADVVAFLLEHEEIGGLFNMGTGSARSFNDLAKATFNAMGKPLNIEYIPMPEELVRKYQYFTEAKMDKLRNAGYTKPFRSLEESVEDYVRNYLSQPDPYFSA